MVKRASSFRVSTFAIATALVAGVLLAACSVPIIVAPTTTEWTEVEGAEAEGKPKPIVFKNAATEEMTFKVEPAPLTVGVMFQVHKNNACTLNLEVARGAECIAWVNINQAIPFEKPRTGALVIEGKVVAGALTGRKGKVEATLKTK